MLHNYYIANKRFFKPCGMIYTFCHRGVCLIGDCSRDARAHPRPAPGERAPRSSGGVIEPRAVRRRGSSDQVLPKTKNHRNGGFLFLVEHRGFEPLTSTLPVLRAPNCANAPWVMKFWWAIKGSNLGPTGYEPVALTN